MPFLHFARLQNDQQRSFCLIFVTYQLGLLSKVQYRGTREPPGSGITCCRHPRGAAGTGDRARVRQRVCPPPPPDPSRASRDGSGRLALPVPSLKHSTSSFPCRRVSGKAERCPRDVTEGPPLLPVTTELRLSPAASGMAGVWATAPGRIRRTSSPATCKPSATLCPL